MISFGMYTMFSNLENGEGLNAQDLRPILSFSYE